MNVALCRRIEVQPHAEPFISSILKRRHYESRMAFYGLTGTCVQRLLLTVSQSWFAVSSPSE
jgi:hypothetical protein